MSFENNIQQWVLLDNQIKLFSEKLKELREKRNSLSENIHNHVNSNHLSNSTVQISDGKIKFVNTRVAEPLTFRYLEKTLNEIIKNEAQVKTILEHIKQKREIKTVSEIRRFYRN
jgi:hypothetical protein